MRKRDTFLMLILAGLLPLAARADQTLDGGPIGDATWAAGEVITVNYTITVNGHLIIQPGVSVRFAEFAGVEVAATGTLTVNGTQGDRVRFEPIATTPKYWYGIYIGAGGTISLSYADLSHCRYAIDSYGGNVTLQHCRISDVAGEDRPNAGLGGSGDGGQDTYAVGLKNHSTAVITDTSINGVRGGNGGAGGNADPGIWNDGGSGGSGGAAWGIYAYNLDQLVFERNVIGNISGGNGAPGGNGILTGFGGSGGSPQGAVAFDYQNAPSIVMRNCVIHHITGGLAAPGGTAGPNADPGSDGMNGQPAGVYGLQTNGTLDLEHFTFDALGTANDDQSVGFLAYFGGGNQPTATVINSTFTNFLANGVNSGVREGSSVTLNAVKCNFFNALSPFDNSGNLLSNISVAPGFVNAANGDYHLMSDSALIGMAQAATATDDIDGQTRDGSPDVGADEYVPYVGRDFGDFDDSHCTDLGDFLYLLDNWLLDPGNGTPIGITDFLALLDYWNLGSACP